MKIPKRPGAEFAEEMKARHRQEMQDYFDSLRIIDTDAEVIASRLLINEPARYKIDKYNNKHILVYEH